MAEREPQPMQRSIGALELVCGAKALLVPSERLGVVTFVLSEAALLEAQARERLGVGAEVIPSLLVRLPRAGVVAAELEHVGEALPHPADPPGRLGRRPARSAMSPRVARRARRPARASRPPRPRRLPSRAARRPRERAA